MPDFDSPMPRGASSRAAACTDALADARRPAGSCRRNAAAAILLPLLMVLPMLGRAGRAMAAGAGDPAQRHPDVLQVQVTPRGGGRYDFAVTVSSPYDTPQRYADAFRVTDEQGRVLGERILLHDHAGEQPFTRELLGVQVPAGVRRVQVQARDRQFGYGGAVVARDLPGR